MGQAGPDRAELDRTRGTVAVTTPPVDCAGCLGSVDLVLPTHPPVFHGITLDLDDTLFPQAEWLAGAWQAVAAAAERDHGLPATDFLPALVRVAAEGSDKGRIIDRALAAVGADRDPATLVQAFKDYRAESLTPFVGVREALDAVRHLGLRIAIITDGYPPGQRNKIDALGLAPLVDAIVVSDEIGRGARKPHPLPFHTAASLLDVPPAAMIHVGDRPEKDLAGAAAAGFAGAIRVRTGEYASTACGTANRGPMGPACVATVVDALHWLIDDRAIAALKTETRLYQADYSNSSPPNGLVISPRDGICSQQRHSFS